MMQNISGKYVPVKFNINSPFPPYNDCGYWERGATNKYKFIAEPLGSCEEIHFLSGGKKYTF
jgi:hypothetical protein